MDLRCTVDRPGQQSGTILRETYPVPLSGQVKFHIEQMPCKATGVVCEVSTIFIGSEYYSSVL